MEDKIKLTIDKEDVEVQRTTGAMMQICKIERIGIPAHRLVNLRFEGYETVAEAIADPKVKAFMRILVNKRPEAAYYLDDESYKILLACLFEPAYVKTVSEETHYAFNLKDEDRHMLGVLYAGCIDENMALHSIWPEDDDAIDDLIEIAAETTPRNIAFTIKH